MLLEKVVSRCDARILRLFVSNATKLLTSHQKVCKQKGTDTIKKGFFLNNWTDLGVDKFTELS